MRRRSIAGSPTTSADSFLHRHIRATRRGKGERHVKALSPGFAARARHRVACPRADGTRLRMLRRPRRRRRRRNPRLPPPARIRQPVVTPTVTNPPNPPTPADRRAAGRTAEGRAEEGRQAAAAGPLEVGRDALRLRRARRDLGLDAGLRRARRVVHAIARPGTYAGDHGQLTFTPRNSRIGFKLAAPETNDIKASAQLEMDFLGNQPPGISEASLYGNATFRFRHMNVKLETPVRRHPRGPVLEPVRLAVAVSTRTPSRSRACPGEVYSRVAADPHRQGDQGRRRSTSSSRSRRIARPSARRRRPTASPACKLMLPQLKAWHTAGSTGSSLDAARSASRSIGRRFTPSASSRRRRASRSCEERLRHLGRRADRRHPSDEEEPRRRAHADQAASSTARARRPVHRLQRRRRQPGAAEPSDGAHPAPRRTRPCSTAASRCTRAGRHAPPDPVDVDPRRRAVLHQRHGGWISANYSHMSSGNAHLFGAADQGVRHVGLGRRQPDGRCHPRRARRRRILLVQPDLRRQDRRRPTTASRDPSFSSSRLPAFRVRHRSCHRDHAKAGT